MPALLQDPATEATKQKLINQGQQTYEDVQKNELSRYVTQRTSEGATQDEAMSDYVFMNNALGKDPSFSKYGSSKMMGAMNATQQAQEKYDQTRTDALSFGVGLKKKWDTQVKNDLDSLQQLSHDPAYADWLNSMGLSMKNIVRLRQGRDAYIEGAMSDMKANFSADLKEWGDLKMLREEAGKDYQAKVELMRSEVDNLKNSEKVVERAIDNQGNLRILVEDSNTGQRYVQTFKGFDSPKASSSSSSSASAIKKQVAETQKQAVQTEEVRKLNDFSRSVITAQSGSVVQQFADAYGKRLSDGEISEQQMKDIVEGQMQQLFKKNFASATKESVDDGVLQEYLQAILERYKKDNDWIPFN